MDIKRKYKSEFTELYPPARCTAKLPTDFDKPHLIAELKLDGSRYNLYLGYCPYGRRNSHTLLSRRVSTVDFVETTDGNKLFTHVDKTDNIPHITDCKYSGLEGTVLDGECYRDDFPTTSSIMGSNGKKAIDKQENGWTDKKTGRVFEPGKLYYYVWDIMAYRGVDLRRKPLTERRKILLKVVEKMKNPYVKVMPQFTENIPDLFIKVVSKGGEGLIIKDVRQGYGMSWAKMKKSHDVSTVVTGFKPGQGKYEGQIGALEVGVYSNGKLLPIGFVSGFTDAERSEFTKNFETYKGQVLDVFAHELSKPSDKNPIGRLRHPTYHRFRDDVNAKDCTIEKLRADIKKKPKSNRWKV